MDEIETAKLVVEKWQEASDMAYRCQICGRPGGH